MPPKLLRRRLKICSVTLSRRSPPQSLVVMSRIPSLGDLASRWWIYWIKT